LVPTVAAALSTNFSLRAAAFPDRAASLGFGIGPPVVGNCLRDCPGTGLYYILLGGEALLGLGAGSRRCYPRALVGLPWSRS